MLMVTGLRGRICKIRMTYLSEGELKKPENAAATIKTLPQKVKETNP